ncbi:MAG TPA: CDP-archaeol synthase, partial [Thermoproteales archaeon]|nr:CDP-archaeol synthase [Thermoproteales archaeon]
MNFIYYVKTALLFLPAYISNVSPLLVTRLTGGGTPLDMGMTFIDGRRLLGDNKTIKGTLSIIIVGSIIGLAYDPKFIEFVQAIGVAIGNTVGSFMK